MQTAGNLDIKDIFLIWLFGAMVGGFFGYAIAKPKVVRAKIRELRGLE